MTGGWLLPSLLVLAFASVVGALALRRHRRRLALLRAAQELGLRYSEGDPLGLGRELGADVSETVWGRFDGADVAVATASRPAADDEAEWETRAVGISLTIKVVRGLEVAQRAVGPNARVGVTSDGRISVRSRIPRQRTSSLDPEALPDLLQATARATKSQYW